MKKQVLKFLNSSSSLFHFTQFHALYDQQIEESKLQELMSSYAVKGRF